MKAVARNLSVLAYADHFTLWRYRAHAGTNTATMVDVLTPGFFEPVGDMLHIGDIIHVAALDGGMTLYVAGVGDMRVMAKTVGAGG